MKIQEIIDGICLSLYEIGFPIYTEHVEQGLETPCFLIRSVLHSKNTNVGRTYRRTNRFAIQYIPESDPDPAVIDSVFDCIRSITVDGKIIHGKDIQVTKSEDSMTFTVSYDGFEIFEDDEVIMMDELEVEYG